MTLPLTSTTARQALILGGAALLAMALWLYAPALPPGWTGSDGRAGDAASLTIDGEVEVISADGMVSQLLVPLAVRGDEPILLTEGGRLHASTFMAETAAAAVPATYAASWLDGNGDDLLEPGERALLTVELPVPSPVSPDNPMEIIIRPVDGMPLVIRNVLP